ncbi:hypothetical protein D3C72_2524630 [compost metagenome]
MSPAWFGPDEKKVRVDVDARDSRVPPNRIVRRWPIPRGSPDQQSSGLSMRRLASNRKCKDRDLNAALFHW